MFWTRLILSLAELGLCVVLSVFVVFWSYKSFVKVTVDYDAEAEIRKGNVAVAVLLAALMMGAALIMQESIYPVIGILTVGMGEHSGHSVPTLIGYAAGHLILGFLLSVGSVELAVRFFELLNRELNEDQEIRKGNMAVAVIMGSVILILSFFMKDGISGLHKNLIPQPKLGSIGVAR